jgi:hypothetical protein
VNGIEMATTWPTKHCSPVGMYLQLHSMSVLVVTQTLPFLHLPLLQANLNLSDPHDALVSVGVVNSGHHGNDILFDTTDCLCANQVRPAEHCCFA